MNSLVWFRAAGKGWRIISCFIHLWHEMVLTLFLALHLLLAVVLFFLSEIPQSYRMIIGLCVFVSGSDLFGLKYSVKRERRLRN